MSVRLSVLDIIHGTLARCFRKILIGVSGHGAASVLWSEEREDDYVDVDAAHEDADLEMVVSKGEIRWWAIETYDFSILVACDFGPVRLD